jgi:hypothetical protein
MKMILAYCTAKTILFALMSAVGFNARVAIPPPSEDDPLLPLGRV